MCGGEKLLIFEKSNENQRKEDYGETWNVFESTVAEIIIATIGINGTCKNNNY